VATLTALLLALSDTIANVEWQPHREHQKDLVQWRNLAVVALALDHGL